MAEESPTILVSSSEVLMCEEFLALKRYLGLESVQGITRFVLELEVKKPAQCQIEVVIPRPLNAQP